MDWAAKWPKEAFTLDDGRGYYVEPDYRRVAEAAREWVAARRKKLAGAAAEGGGGAAAAANGGAAAAAAPAPAGADAPPGLAATAAPTPQLVWATFFDSLNRPCAQGGVLRRTPVHALARSPAPPLTPPSPDYHCALLNKTVWTLDETQSVSAAEVAAATAAAAAAAAAAPGSQTAPGAGAAAPG